MARSVQMLEMHVPVNRTERVASPDQNVSQDIVKLYLLEDSLALDNSLI